MQVSQEAQDKVSQPRRRKLGLALSGGGFRASLFHIGVLRRLAELDLLRDLSIISSVSGGSIVAAHYLQLLTPRLEKSPVLSRDEYVRLIRDELEPAFREGVGRNLRTRLFWNPLQNLLMLVTRRTLGERMASLYQRHLYQEAVPEARRASGLLLHELRVSNVEEVASYNKSQSSDRVPRLVLNATTLNTGRNFRFTAAEVGDPVLGYIRYDEAWQVLLHKRLLKAARKGASPQALQSIAAGDPGGLEGAALRVGRPADPATRPTTAWTLAWYRFALGEAAAPDAYGSALRELLVRNQEVRSRLLHAGFELLRNAKVRAWYLNVGQRRARPASGDAGAQEHAALFWSAIADIDKGLHEALLPFSAAPGELFDLVLDLYMLRSADAFAWTAAEALARLRVPEAVAASANFPPVFAPYVLYDLYEPRVARRLALTDGGVFDNQGLTALVEEGCSEIIASDAGGELAADPDVAVSRGGMLLRMSDIFMAEVRGLQVAALRENVRVTGALRQSPAAPSLAPLETHYFVERSAFFHAGSNPNDAIPVPEGIPPYVADEQVIAGLRTDLDGFSDLEMDALVHQGYRMADRFVRAYGFVDGTAPLPQAPVPLPGDPVRATALLEVGKSRTLRALRIIDVDVRGTASLLLLALVAPLVVFGIGAIDLPLRDALAAAGRALARGLLFPLSPPLAAPGTTRIALGAGLVVCVAWLLWARVEAELLPFLKPRNAARLGLWRNQIWWGFYLLPLVIAVAGSALALASYVLFAFIVAPLEGGGAGDAGPLERYGPAADALAVPETSGGRQRAGTTTAGGTGQRVHGLRSGITSR